MREEENINRSGGYVNKYKPKLERVSWYLTSCIFSLNILSLFFLSFLSIIRKKNAYFKYFGAGRLMNIRGVTQKK